MILTLWFGGQAILAAVLAVAAMKRWPATMAAVLTGAIILLTCGL